MFIPGGAVDAGHFAAAATFLSDEFTTVTYNRRGNSRSPRPDGWTPTSIAEQADDAAGLIGSLGLAPAIIWGGSLGGVILLDLLARRPGLVRLAVIHKPPLFSLLPDADTIARGLAALARQGMRTSPRAAMAEHARQVLGDTFERLTPGHRERLIAHAEVFLGVEIPALLAGMPDGTALARTLTRTTVPVKVAASPGNPDAPLWRFSRWIADRLGTGVHELPGGHMPYAIEPESTALVLRRWARALPGEASAASTLPSRASSIRS